MTCNVTAARVPLQAAVCTSSGRTRSSVGGASRGLAEVAGPAAMATVPESEMDITSLLQPRQGYLWKLGGGQEKGSKWNRRW